MLPHVIVGMRGQSRQVVEAINRGRQTYGSLGFLDDNPAPCNVLARRGARVIGAGSELVWTDATDVIGIGSPAERRHVDPLASHAGRIAATLLHPASLIGSDVELGPARPLEGRQL